MNSRQNDKGIVIVGVGSSAGGLEAVSQLLSHLEPKIPHAIVILQHLSPNYKSMMAELLTRETRLIVRALEHDTYPEEGIVYVVPPNKNALVKDGKICLMDAQADIAPKPSINEFFFSLASEYGEKSIGIILSGTGSDGTAGLRAVQAAGGITITQSPDTAKYSGMPCSAIDSGVADIVLPIPDIAKKLMELPSSISQEISLSQSVLEKILNTLNRECNVDFSGYKAGTLSRRVRRRMVATGHQTMEQYLAWIENDTAELELLAKDILISVTSFFRDKSAFEALGTLISKSISELAPDEEFRVWVAGCATGEEAYTLGILVLEGLRKHSKVNQVQIFATDIDEDALNIARQGQYLDSAIKNIPDELIKKYFTVKKNGKYEVGKRLRDMIVFARHNVISDPPFLRLNLVTCRNLLIYFDHPLQSRVLQRFHFALKNDGMLFLGRSESVAQAEQLFSFYDRRERIFHKLGNNRAHIDSQGVSRVQTLKHRQAKTSQTLIDAISHTLSLTTALCSHDGKIIQTSGEVEKFFKFPSGSSEMMIMDVVHPSFRNEFYALFHRLKKSSEPQHGRAVELYDRYWTQTLSYANNKVENAILLVISPLAEKPDNVIKVDHDNFYSDELEATQEQLQSLVEELATANEEMQSLNEEAQASNEELQATNEEMEAANEELQATNEELVSVNEELGVKTSELTRLNDEYAHLYDSLNYPVLVFDRRLHLIRFNSPAASALKLRKNTRNLHVDRLNLPSYLDQLNSLLDKALQEADKQSCSTADKDNIYQLQITPGIDSHGEVQFVVANIIDVTEIQHTRDKLHDSESQLKTIMENTTVLITMKDLSGNYLFANNAFIQAFSIKADDYENKSDFDLFPEEFASQIWSSDLEAIRTREPIQKESVYLENNQLRHFVSRHQVLRDRLNKPSIIITELEDITSRKQAEDKLKIAAKVFQQAGEAIVVTSKNAEIISINKAFTEITGFSEADAIGKPVGELLRSGRHSTQFYADMWNSLNNTGQWQGEIWNKRKDGEIYPEWLTINRILNADNETDYFISVFSDITDLKDSQRKVEFLATHDSLTGLPNRNLFLDRLDNASARCKRNNTSLALLYLDIDNFKTINDTLGHDVGDQLLIKISDKLKRCIRDIDTVSRLGGDEFTLVLSECEPLEAQEVAQRILAELSDPIELNNRKLFTSASIGIAIYPVDSDNSGGLLKSADTAMYQAKASGRNCYRFFHEDMWKNLLKEATMESNLKDAIRHKQFRLVFQPVFSAKDQTLSGAECLIRWLSPVAGEISPAEFIPIAERSTAILDIDNLVVDMLAEQIARWKNKGFQIPTLSFNISTQSLVQDDFAKNLISTLDSYLVAPDLVKMEITERSLMDNSSSTADNLSVLQKVGIKTAIDDFGTDYSSLRYLKQLPLNELKIDKGFVDGLGEDEDDETICKAILSMAKALRLSVVAEGVETEQQQNWLKKNKCDYLQGFLLSKPLEVSDFEKLLPKQQ